MTDRQILFTGPMVRAILEGRKSQARRVLPPQPFVDGYFEGDVDCTFVPAAASNLPAYFRFGASAVGGGAIRTETYEPRYAVGDRLYVCEAWKTHAAYNDISPSAMGGDEAILYEADGAHQTWGYPAISKIGRFRQGMHMPRWASRLTLVVTDVRVERLQDISAEDAIAEGLAKLSKDAAFHERRGTEPTWKYGVPDRDGLPGSDDYGWAWEHWNTDPRQAYRRLWDSINVRRGYGWDTNPWVIAVSFDVRTRNIDQMPGCKELL